MAYLLAASSFFKSSNSSIETSLGNELLLVQDDVLPESELSPFGVEVDLVRFNGFSTEVPFVILFSLIAGIVLHSELASDMTTSFADPVDEVESFEDTDSIDVFRLDESSLEIDVDLTLCLICGCPKYEWLKDWKKETILVSLSNISYNTIFSI